MGQVLLAFVGMVLPPIVLRELQYRARLGKTWWIRLGVVVLALLAWLVPIMLGRAAFDSGRASLATLSVCPLIIAIFSGAFTTADAISREKREGTLPLLFLTPLHPAEILIQKTISTTAPLLMGLLALAPLYALPVVLGGVTGVDVISVMAFVLAGGALSVALGCMVSCLTLSASSAVAGTFLTVSVFFGASLLMDAAQWPVASEWFRLMNPLQAYIHYFRQPAGLNSFAEPIFVFANALLAGTVLILGASLVLPRLTVQRCERGSSRLAGAEPGFSLLPMAGLLAIAGLADAEGVLLGVGLVAANLGKVTVLVNAIRVLGDKPWMEVILTTPLSPLKYIEREFRASVGKVGFVLAGCLAIQFLVIGRLTGNLRDVAIVLAFFVVVDSAALLFVGLWNGLRCRSASHAISLSVSSVVLVPVAIGLFSLAFGFKTETFAGGLVLWTVLGLIVDVLSGCSANWMLQNRLRVTVSTRL